MVAVAKIVCKFNSKEIRFATTESPSQQTATATTVWIYQYITIIIIWNFEQYCGRAIIHPRLGAERKI